MDSFWKVVLASSVVSTVISTGVALISKWITDIRQKEAAAQRIARGLEGYCRKCATEITATLTALELAYEKGLNDPLSGRGFPPIELDLSGVDWLNPDWRDQVSAFPVKVEWMRNRLGKEWNDAVDQFAFAEYEMKVEAEMGRAAFDLAMKLRAEYGLPAGHAKNECREALEIFVSQAKTQQSSDEANASHNAGIQTQISAVA